MAPRPPESKQDFIARLTAAAAAGQREVRFGAPHHSHAVCREREGDAWTVRRLERDVAAEDAYRATHSSFMPEHAEMLAVPGLVVVEARPLAALIRAIEKGWPFAS